MKNLTYITAAITFFFSINSAIAQGPNATNNSVPQTSEEINNSLARYYYYPNLQSYYDSETATYLFVVNGEWMEGNAIPTNYRGYGVKNDLRIALPTYSGETPFDMIAQHKKMFPADYSTKRKAPKTKSLNEVASR